MIAKNYVRGKCKVEIIDSKSVSMGCGLVAIAAAKAAVGGATLQQVMGIANNTL